MEKTEWFPGNVKPAHKGVYETKVYEGKETYQYWDGEYWNHYKPNPYSAYAEMYGPSSIQGAMWRGLTEPVE